MQQSSIKCDVSDCDYKALIREGHCPTISMGGGVRSAVHRIKFLSDNRIQYITLTVCVVVYIMYAVLHCFECYCQTVVNSDDSRVNFCKEQNKNSATFLWTVSLLSSFSKTAIVGHISQMKPASASSLQSIFLLQLSLLSFVEEYLSVDIQLSSRP